MYLRGWVGGWLLSPKSSVALQLLTEPHLMQTESQVLATRNAMQRGIQIEEQVRQEMAMAEEAEKNAAANKEDFVTRERLLNMALEQAKHAEYMHNLVLAGDPRGIPAEKNEVKKLELHVKKRVFQKGAVQVAEEAAAALEEEIHEAQMHLIDWKVVTCPAF
jgi:hypothetical protein